MIETLDAAPQFSSASDQVPSSGRAAAGRLVAAGLVVGLAAGAEGAVTAGLLVWAGGGLLSQAARASIGTSARQSGSARIGESVLMVISV